MCLVSLFYDGGIDSEGGLFKGQKVGWTRGSVLCRASAAPPNVVRGWRQRQYLGCLDEHDPSGLTSTIVLLEVVNKHLYFTAFW
jgi:hypothetical protein